MLLSLTINNCLIYNSEVELSLKANMHYKRFQNNVTCIGHSNVLKTAILIGPNNSGKTNLVRIIGMLKELMLGRSTELGVNLFSGNPVVELSVSFIDGETEYSFEIKYDATKNEYIYEKFAEFRYDKHNNVKLIDRLVRDNINKYYYAEDEGLADAMKITSRNNILIYLVDTDNFPHLNKIKDIIRKFAAKIDIVDMNNIPIKKTIEMLKSSEAMRKKIANFVLNADLNLEDFRYLNDNEIHIEFESGDNTGLRPQENALNSAAPITEMLHLASVYKGVTVPSLLYDSTGTKKMAALASYVIDALETGRILIVDELDNSLHFRLTRAIISLFNNELNRNAQLIATVHDVSLLDCRTLFRKEQIWFTHKDRENAYLYSLSEFTNEQYGVRESTDLIDKYRKGVFGALPEPDLFESLLEVKQNA